MRRFFSVSSFVAAITHFSILLGLLFVISPMHASAQDDEELEADGLARGLLAEFVQQETRTERIDTKLAFDWTNSPIDQRLEQVTFSGTWKGYLESEAKGTYQFAAAGHGTIEIKLGNSTLLESTDLSKGVAKSGDIDLRPDLHDFSIHLKSGAADSGSLKLFWRGPNFDWEPIASNRLYHELDQTVDSLWQEGRRIVASHRCDACHIVNTGQNTLPAVERSALGKFVSRNWLRGHLSAQPSERTSSNRRMPFYSLSQNEVDALVAFLQHSEESSAEIDDHTTDSPTENTYENISLGETLTLTTGCLGCHTVNNVGNPSEFDGGDLSGIGDKRSQAWLTAWLSNPKSVNKHHRMPKPSLSNSEIEQISSYLSSLNSDEAADLEEAGITASLLETGESLFRTLQCGNCHLEANANNRDGLNKVGLSNAHENGCLDSNSSTSKTPRYFFTDQQKRAIARFLSEPIPTGSVRTEWMLESKNCFGCHDRGEQRGLRSTIDEVIKYRSELEKTAAAMKPPSLNNIGDKLPVAAIHRFLREGGNSRRPWLTIRMPVYELDESEQTDISDWMISSDRLPSGLRESLPTVSEQIVSVHGARLVTSEGFGCTSCHQIGSNEPSEAPLNAKGPSLSDLRNHVRAEWFERWVRNPSRMEPGMEMPSISLPVHGVLSDNLDQQLGALWQTLNRPGFEPPRPNPVRVVRQSGLDPTQPAKFLTDVIRTDSHTYIKPLVIGLPNRQNILFDLEQASLAGWWSGDVGREHTEGKTWFWEAGGPLVWQSDPKQMEWMLVQDGKLLPSQPQGQFQTELDRWQLIEGGIEFEYRLSFKTNSNTTQSVTIREKVTSSSPSNSESKLQGASWQRKIEASGLTDGQTLGIQLPSKSTVLSATNEQIQVLFDNPIPITTEWTGAGVKLNSEQRIVEWVPVDGSVICIQYNSEVVADTWPPVDVKPKQYKPAQLNVVPGFAATILPFDEAWMPTAMSWGDDGTLYVASLKGRIWKVRDEDQDGLEDVALPLPFELAAPFGLQANRDSLDVINKYGLLRLTDSDQDGQFDQGRTLASGWGHTADYHDWAVGLPQDKAGNYYIALSCQQDKRSAEAAKWRGTILKLIKPSNDNDARYQIEEHSAGHRFPIGIALNADDELFVTDNQGNYNPFNELNHARPGARYGFINALEKGSQIETPPSSPAINIPHPWTRSVNGVCFLSDGEQKDHFGPFTGDLIGCEYDTRRLVRMSLEAVNGQWQGAVYPFSYESPPSGEPLLGPLACAVSPTGELYVGCIRDSGWGGANNVGNLVRLRFNPEELPAGIDEVRAASDGLVIQFTRPASKALASDLANYQVSSFRRISTPQYGGPDVDRRFEKPTEARVADDGLSVKLVFESMRAGFVYHLQLNGLTRGSEEFFPAEAFYSLNQIPQDD